MQLLLHLFFHVAMSVGVGFRVFEEDAELAVEASFNVLAVVEEDTRFGSKLELLVLGENVLFQSLDRRYPRWFTDEGCNFVDSRLDVWQNLNS